MIEVEIKAKVPSLDVVKAKLLEKGAVLKGEAEQRDMTYGLPHDFPPKDGGVIGRIRKRGGKIVLELKEIDREKGGIELPFVLQEIEPYNRFLKKLGFKLFFETVNLRANYELNGFTISLDRVRDLGEFIEIEKIVSMVDLKDATILECKALLDELAPDAEITKQKYGDMQCKRLGISRKD